MANITTRASKGAPLSWDEADANFTNLNTDKVETSLLANYSTTVETDASIAAALAVHIDDTIDAHVSSAISYLPAGTGAVARDVQSKLREFVSVKDFGAVGDGVTDDTYAVLLANNHAASVRTRLVFPTGVYKLTDTITFTAEVEMFDGAVLTCSDSTKYFRFSRGFIAGLNPCIDTDAPTQFVGIEAIYPQWFGNCGLTSQDSTIALRRAFRAIRAGMNGISAVTDASFGCVRVHLIRGNYRCNDVDVYNQTIVTGEVSGAINCSAITQIDRTKPALRVHAKNYSLTNTVLNSSNGINTFHRLNFRSEQISDSFTNEYVVRFYSPTESIALLGVPGDAVGGDVGHIDTRFERCWFQFTPGHSIGAEDGRLSFWCLNCTWDVVRGGVKYGGTSFGDLKVIGDQAFECVRSFIEVTTSSANAVDLYLYDLVMNGGNPQNATSTYRNLIHYQPTGSTAGQIHIKSCRARRVDDSGTRFGGPLWVHGAQKLVIDDLDIEDPDSAGFQKALSLNVAELYINGLRIKSNSLNSYTNSRLISFSTKAPTVLNMRDVTLYNTSGSAISEGVQSDVVITGGDFDVKFVGSFTTNYNTNILANNLRNSIRRLTVEKPGTTVPVSGTWSVGDRVINSAPAVGQPKAWVCTVAGTPGTWVSEGNL